MYSIRLPESLAISYCSLLVQSINITSRTKTIILENKTKKAQVNKQTNSLTYDSGFAEINTRLDQQHFWWGDWTISHVKYEKKIPIGIIKLAAYGFLNVTILPPICQASKKLLKNPGYVVCHSKCCHKSTEECITVSQLNNFL